MRKLIIALLALLLLTTPASAQLGHNWYWYTYPGDTSRLAIGDQVEIIAIIEGLVFNGVDLWTVGPVAGGSPAYEVIDTPKWYTTSDLCEQCWLSYQAANPDGSHIMLAYTIRITDTFQAQSHFGVFVVDGGAYGLIPQIEFGYIEKDYLPMVLK